MGKLLEKWIDKRWKRAQALLAAWWLTAIAYYICAYVLGLWEVRDGFRSLPFYIVVNIFTSIILLAVYIIGEIALFKFLNNSRLYFLSFIIAVCLTYKFWLIKAVQLFFYIVGDKP
ncbi:MAG: hypothetical protein EB060_07435 [Proteobacteria bacterium]|nr:hypothetical protein [Pseudomonadota bacterium]